MSLAQFNTYSSGSGIGVRVLNIKTNLNNIIAGICSGLVSFTVVFKCYFSEKYTEIFFLFHKLSKAQIQFKGLFISKTKSMHLCFGALQTY